MRILVTGGAGFIGQHLARLLRDEHELTALDLLLPQVHLDPQVSRGAFPGEVIVADAADPATWDGIPAPDLLIHLAAETGTGQSMYEADRYRRTNIEGTRLAGDAAAHWGVPLISMSSRAVYGEGRYECPKHCITFGGPCCDLAVPAASRETDQHRPVSVYGETKSAAEAALAAVAPLVPVTVIRPQNVVGPGQALHNPYTGVLAAFLARLREGRSLLVYGDGTATRDIVHVEDLASLVEWCALTPAPVGEARVLNCGTGVRTTLDQLAAAAAEGSPAGTAAIEHVAVHRAGDIDHACADLGRIRSLGAPLPRLTSHEAIVDFVRRSWDMPGAASQAWSAALDELGERGLAT